MKYIAVIILIVLCIASLSPLTVVQRSSGEQTVFIKTLNVCHQSGDMIFGSMEMPFVSECPCSQSPSNFANYLESPNTVNNFPLITFPIDLPPKV